MAGLEIAGVVLGAFPILLNLRDYYKRSCQPFTEWLHFESAMIDLLDEIEHQRMQYNWTMNELLRSAITDKHDRDTLLYNAQDSRWTDRALLKAFEERLGQHYDRCIRLLRRMHTSLDRLGKILGIEDGKATWLGRPNREQLVRIRVSMSTAKRDCITSLQRDNERLREILGCSEQLYESSKESDPMITVLSFEEVRRSACKVDGALSTYWMCTDPICKSHLASLKLGAGIEARTLDLLFSWEDPSRSPHSKRRISIQSATGNVPTVQVPARRAAQVPSSVGVQSYLAERKSRKKSTNLLLRLSGRSQPQSPGGLFSPSLSRSVPPQTQVMQKAVFVHPWKPILDLCKTLKVSQTHELGVLKGQNDEAFCLFDPSTSTTTVTDASHLSSLCEILNLNTQDEVEMHRSQRFSMAANIACALLQAQRSPWLSRQWTKSEIYFLVTEDYPAHVVEAIPYVTRTYATTPAVAPSWDGPALVSADVARTVLFRLGVVIMELVFGRPIESTKYYKHYEVKTVLTPEEVEYLSARQWERRVLSEAGERVQSVIRRCLDCSFEPEPDLKLEDFRAAIYRGVVLPLLNYNQSTWP